MVFNSGDYDANDVLDRADDLAKAGVDVKKAKKLSEVYAKALVMAQNVGEYFEKNKKFLDHVKKMVWAFTTVKEGEEKSYMFVDKSEEFLRLYRDYDPNVKRGEIVKFGALIQELANQACDLVFEGISVGSASSAGYVVTTGDCITLPADLAALNEVYTQMYDFQFELMDALAEIVRGTLAFISADELSKAFQEKNVKLDNTILLKLFTMKVLVVNRIYKIKGVTDYCNYLEYINGGQVLQVCKNAIDTLADADIDKLSTYKSEVLRCSNPVSHIVFIPTNKTKDDDEAFIDLKNLYVGRPISFRIPDANWLVQNRWINTADVRDHVYFLHDMKIFLPDVADHGRWITTKVKASSKNTKLFPGEQATRYLITNEEIGSTQIDRFEFGYQDQMHPSACRREKVRENPSDLCREKNQKITDICVKETTAKGKDIHPSVFSTWVIESKMGKEAVGNVNITTPAVHVAAEVTICSKRVPHVTCNVMIHGSCTEPVVERRNRKRCCGGKNEYWNPIEKANNGNLGRCMPCPADSTLSITGTFCRGTQVQDKSKVGLQKY